MSAIFGGSKQKSKSSSQSQQTSQNLAFPWAQEQFTPQVRQGNQASSAIAALLGLGGDSAAASAAMQNYNNSAGYQQTLDSGSRSITNNAASRGLLGSGSTLKRLMQFGQENSQKYFSDYIAKLLGLTQAGQNAGQIVTGAGNYSTGQSSSSGTGSGSSTGGLASLIGAVL